LVVTITWGDCPVFSWRKRPVISLNSWSEPMIVRSALRQTESQPWMIGYISSWAAIGSPFAIRRRNMSRESSRSTVTRDITDINSDGVIAFNHSELRRTTSSSGSSRRIFSA
jgi:hypothetical protein